MLLKVLFLALLTTAMSRPQYGNGGYGQQQHGNQGGYGGGQPQYQGGYYSGSYSRSYNDGYNGGYNGGYDTGIGGGFDTDFGAEYGAKVGGQLEIPGFGGVNGGLGGKVYGRVKTGGHFGRRRRSQNNPFGFGYNNEKL